MMKLVNPYLFGKKSYSTLFLIFHGLEKKKKKFHQIDLRIVKLLNLSEHEMLSKFDLYVNVFKGKKLI